MLAIETRPTWFEKGIQAEHWEQTSSKLHEMLHITKEDEKILNLFYETSIFTIKTR